MDACSGIVAIVVSAADEKSHAEARRAKPSQASQSREGLTNRIGYLPDGTCARHPTHNGLWNWMYSVSDWQPARGEDMRMPGHDDLGQGPASSAMAVDPT